jgi:hypothetical protein
MKKRLGLSLAIAALLVAPCTFAADSSNNATIQFTLDFPHSNPEHYEITVPSEGAATYTSNGELGSGANPDTTPFQFEISDKTRQDLFALAKKANYFSGKLDSGNTHIANMGSKTLAYKDASHNTSATYNYSLDPAVNDMTSTLQKLSTVLEYGRRLSWFEKYQKLALEDDLKAMEDRQRQDNLGDVRAIAPLLKKIAYDQSVMRMTRARALRLLATVGQ